MGFSCYYLLKFYLVDEKKSLHRFCSDSSIYWKISNEFLIENSNKMIFSTTFHYFLTSFFYSLNFIIFFCRKKKREKNASIYTTTLLTLLLICFLFFFGRQTDRQTVLSIPNWALLIRMSVTLSIVHRLCGASIGLCHAHILSIDKKFDTSKQGVVLCALFFSILFTSLPSLALVLLASIDSIRQRFSIAMCLVLLVQSTFRHQSDRFEESQ